MDIMRKKRAKKALVLNAPFDGGIWQFNQDTKTPISHRAELRVDSLMDQGGT